MNGYGTNDGVLCSERRLTLVSAVESKNNWNFWLYIGFCTHPLYAIPAVITKAIGTIKNKRRRSTEPTCRSSNKKMAKPTSCFWLASLCPGD